MGGEGSMAHANQSLKQNRSLLRRKQFKKRKILLLSYSGKTVAEFKKIPPKELSLLKEQIKIKARKEQKKTILIFLLSILITTTSFYLIIINN